MISFLLLMKVLERSRSRRIERRDLVIFTLRVRGSSCLHVFSISRYCTLNLINANFIPSNYPPSLGHSICLPTWRQVKSPISCWVHRECAVILPYTSFFHDEDEPTNYVLDPFYIAQNVFFSIIAITLNPKLSLPR